MHKSLITHSGALPSFVLVACCLLIAGCSSGGSSGDANSPVTTSGTPGNNNNTNTGNDGVIPTLTAGSVISDQVEGGNTTVVRVPAGSQIVLTSLAGNADLYLSSNTSYDQEFCAAARPWREDICASPSDTETYALVYGRTDATFSIAATQDCSTPSVNDWVYRSMQDYYLFYDQLPQVNPGDYDSPQALVRELRFNELDDFSNVQTAAAQLDRAENGRTKDLGVLYRRDTSGDLRIARVYPGSPADDAGISRGDTVVEINGIPEADVTGEQFSDFLGTDDNPKLLTFLLRDWATGNDKTGVLSIGDYTIKTVTNLEILSRRNADKRMGYMVFNAFLETSDQELDAAFRFFTDEQITSLIVDLRYNGGGRARITQKLASMLGGSQLTGSLMYTNQYSDKYAYLDNPRNFIEQENSLALTDLVFLTTGSTASASEALINSLKPYINVTTFGSTTRGKPYTSGARQYCGYALNAVQSKRVNSVGVDVTNGIAADCYAQDDLTRDFGLNDSKLEGMLLQAANYITDGTGCEVAPGTSLAESAPTALDAMLQAEELRLVQ